MSHPAAQGTTLALEYLSYAINSVLYLRGVYPANSFKQIEHPATGLSLMVSNDTDVTNYLGAILSQIAMWLSQGKIKAISLVIFPDVAPPPPAATGGGGGSQENQQQHQPTDIIERWTFQFRDNGNSNISQSSHAATTGPQNLASALRHLTASAGMLPQRRGVSTFEVITYNTADVFPAPRSWEASDPMELENADELPLRPFNCNGGLVVDGFITFYNNE